MVPHPDDEGAVFEDGDIAGPARILSHEFNPFLKGFTSIPRDQQAMPKPFRIPLVGTGKDSVRPAVPLKPIKGAKKSFFPDVEMKVPRDSVITTCKDRCRALR